MADARYVVGIDLGTTNSALAYLDLAGAGRRSQAGGEAPRVELLPIPQLVAPGSVAARPTLPSFLYLPGARDLPAGALDLPWRAEPGFTAGELARSHGWQVPGRLISSAKSWLCHPGVDRTAPILPWQPPPEAEDLQRLSPIEASSRYLEHLAAAWRAAFPDAPLGEQDVLLTVPASFDAVARELTVRAAAMAGLENVTLLEEPQAAFYSWLAVTGDDWRRQLAVGDRVLVCDIGGGTTDFTLIAVTEADGALALERIAVGDHILLGGDNMDLALAYVLKERLAREGKPLDPWQVRSLTQSTRAAKEALLAGAAEAGERPAEPGRKSAGDESDRVPVTVLGRGSKVIGGALRTELSRADVEEILVGGFFPRCAASDRPQERRRVGLAEVGLPFAADAAVTRHLASFLSRHAAEGARGGGPGFVQPTALLFNGGVMKAARLRARLGEAIGEWLAAEGAPAPVALRGTDLDLAVAHGAAYYGLVRRGGGVRIRGGTARTYYVGVESSMPAVPGLPPPLKALCVVPRGMEEGTSAEIPELELALVVGEPVEFRFLSATAREDRTGVLLDAWGEGEIQELAPLTATLPETPGAPAGSAVPVTLSVKVTEVGTLELWCRSRAGERWKLEWNVREAPPGGR